jgi:hypothetical protein
MGRDGFRLSGLKEVRSNYRASDKVAGSDQPVEKS